MTTIAWDGKTLAGDRRISSGTVVYTSTKVRLTADGRLIGATGDYGVCIALLDWLENGGKRPECQDSDRWASALEIMPDGTIWMHNRETRWKVEDEFVAVGSGRDYAMAVMALGHSARVGVEIASRFDPGTGNGVDELRFRATADRQDGGEVVKLVAVA
jgi:ATP-dependent protease HslVU (ClpYQ) peptidase subunit